MAQARTRKMRKNRIKTQNVAGFIYPVSKINAKLITKTLIFVQFCGRPPRRGAWIEIVFVCCGNKVLESPPAQGGVD